MSEKSYYQRNRDVLLTIMEPVKKDSQSMQGINTETFLKKKRTNREYRKNRYHNISETKTKRISKQIIVRLKSLNEKSVK